MPETVDQVRMQYLHPEVFHHRTLWGDMPALRDSIADHNVIEPLIIRDRKEGGYWITCGVRRFKAAGMAGLKTIPCIKRELDDADAIAMQVDENQQREGLHPIDEALYYEELANRGMNHEAIAKRFQVKKRDVVRRLKLLALSPKARKAFIDGRFDEEAALDLAIGLTGDAARQADVLAALDAGTLQPEEISAYVRREFTANLDDVPWRMTDEKLVVKAGPCTTCHKRSDVQRDLFGADQKGLRCLDVGCFRGKMEATWQRELARPEVALHEQAADALFVLGEGRPRVLRSSGMVDADAPCPHVTGFTWRESVFKVIPEGADTPTVYLARDQDGRPRFLFRESTVGKIVKKSDLAKAEVANDAPSDGPDPTQQSTRAENKIRKQVVLQLALIVSSGDYDVWGWVTERILDSATPRSVSLAAAMLEPTIRGIESAAKLEGKPGLLELARQSNRQAKRVAAAVLIFEEADVASEINDALALLAAQCDIDIVAAEHEIRKVP